MTQAILLVFISLIAFYFLVKLRVIRRESKYFKWLWLFFEFDLIAIALIAALLASFILGGFALNHFYFKKRRTRADMQELRVQIKEYHKNHKAYPSKLEELASGRPLKKSLLIDRWGKPYRFEIEEQKVVIISAGRDEIFNTKDDLILR